MSKLARAMASWIDEAMAREIRSLSGTNRECRAVFSGPPPALLERVFKELAGDGRLLRASTAEGTLVEFPVVLQVESIPPEMPLAGAQSSGACLFHGLASIRNDPGCGVFLTLVPPGGQASDTHESTRKSFGVSPVVNEGSSSISGWWEDAFIQTLVGQVLEDGNKAEIEHARRLVHAAIVAADAADEHAAARPGAWKVLERLWDLKGSHQGFDSRVSLATGFPPSSGSGIDAEDKERALSALVDKLEEVNFGGGIAQLKERARDDAERTHLEEFLHHLRGKCDVVTALRRSVSHFYSPDEIDPAPGWWEALTAERWLELLDDGGSNEPGDAAIGISCLNPLVSHLKGFVPVVRDSAQVRIELPPGLESARVRLTREGGGAANKREWQLSGGLVFEVEDDTIPAHRTPVKYVAEVLDAKAKKATLRIISLGAWMPGVVVCSRTATKGSAPKTSKGVVAFETSLTMTGHGRHYLDVYVRPGVEIVSANAMGSDEHGQLDVSNVVSIARVSDNEFGMEVEAAGDCFYQFAIKRPESTGNGPETFRVTLSADEASPEECSSHFELLLLRNARRDGGRLPRSVHINGQLRSAQLQAWLLDADHVSRSYYPFVLAPDYSSHWRPRAWTSAADTVFSAGSFLNDPRPQVDEMIAPLAFLKAREEIASRIRGKDGNDLIELASLGEWLATDAAFATAVDAYVRAYADWLSVAPEEATWCDIGLVTRFEGDGVTLLQEPDAILVSPLHPVRLAWHCLAQRAMYLAQRKLPCPAASILDPDCVPDAMSLPLRNATGGISQVLFFSVECSSDYWGILWNAGRLDLLAMHAAQPPLDREMGLLVGGISSGFSVSQVHRALEDVCAMLVAKPVVGVMVSSAAGQNNACNEGIISWGRKHFAIENAARARNSTLGASEIHILDDRKAEARPDDAEISNLAEDTSNAVQWFSGASAKDSPDLAIIAQLETSNASALPTKLASSLGVGGLVRTRIREQLHAASGQLLCESRMANSPTVFGDGLADNTAKAISLLENLSESRMGYVFAPSVHAVTNALSKAEFAAVSSSAVDPACFLGNWLEGTYLWDYELPSYSGRSGDSNGYYLLSRIKELDLDTLKAVLSRLPGCDALPREAMARIVQEVSRRGIPTVRGLSAGDSGATGDLGLLVATRLLQDGFRGADYDMGLLPPWTEANLETQLVLVIPVDPFQGYIDDLARAIKKPALHRPDLIVVALCISDSQIRCKLTPVEVKNRSGTTAMTTGGRLEALGQAQSLSALLISLRETFSEDPEMLLWRLAYQNLLTSMIGYGFRVYSQQLATAGRSNEWSHLHSRVMNAILSSELVLDVDSRGRLIVIDGSAASGPRDTDGDGFQETVQLSQEDAGRVVRGDADAIYVSMRARIADWEMLPSSAVAAPAAPAPESTDASSSQSAEDVTPSSDTADALVVSAEDSVPMVVDAVASGVEPREANWIEGHPQEDGNQTGLNLRIGETVDVFQTTTKWLNLGHTSLNQLNMGVVGDLGTGKTQLLKSLVYQVATGQQGNRGVRPNVLIFDYKRDYSAEDFVQAVDARVIRPVHLPINIFDLSGAAQSISPWLDRYRFFADTMGKIYPGIGPVQRDRLKNAIKDAYGRSNGGPYPTIYDVHQNYVDALKGGADSLSGILGDLVDMELFTSKPEEIISADKFLEGVVVLSLDELGQDDRTKNMLVAIMLNLFYEHMLRIPKRPFLGINRDMRVVDSMLLVDEADNIMQYEFDVLRKILLQGREFGVGVILASQYLSHFKAGGTDYREPLLTWFIHKVPNLRPQELGALGLNDPAVFSQLAERIKGLGLHECLYKTHDAPGEIIKGAAFYRRSEWADEPN